jgi:hypothetical protein
VSLRMVAQPWPAGSVLAASLGCVRRGEGTAVLICHGILSPSRHNLSSSEMNWWA